MLARRVTVVIVQEIVAPVRGPAVQMIRAHPVAAVAPAQAQTAEAAAPLEVVHRVAGAMTDRL